MKTFLLALRASKFLQSKLLLPGFSSSDKKGEEIEKLTISTADRKKTSDKFKIPN